MTTILLIIHFLGFSLGIGGGVANLFAGRKAAADAVARPALGALSKSLGRLATGGLILLWLTGVAMVYTSWEGWGELPGLFWAKFASVLVLTVCSALANLHVIRAGRSGTPPPAATMARLGQIGVGAAIVALILAVPTFSMI